MKIVQRVQEIRRGQELEGVNPMTLKVDIDLDSADPVHGFCTSSHQEGHLGEVNYKSFKEFR